MEIIKKQLDNALEIAINGRLDAYWSDHLAAAIDESIRQGSHRIRLNLRGLEYLSSAGIRVLLKYVKQLSAIQGSLLVVEPSEAAYSILELAGLASLVVTPAEDRAAAAAPAEEARPARRQTTETAQVQVFNLAPGTLKCALVGDPGKLESGGYKQGDSRSQAYPASTFGLGLGAFGKDFADCQERFGEFLAVGGAAAYLPSDGTSMPDYMVSEGLLVPELEVLYAVTGQGVFDQLIRFEAKPEPPGLITLAELVNLALETADADVIGMIVVAETAGLVGASLKQSPAKGKLQGSPLSFPAVRDWLSFTTERAFDQTVSVVVGLAARKADPPLNAWLRPIGPGTEAQGHFHAAVFPYRPLQRGVLDLHDTINGLFSAESIQGLLHLLPDERSIDGIGQSEFLRGACWVGAVAEIKPT